MIVAGYSLALARVKKVVHIKDMVRNIVFVSTYIYWVVNRLHKFNFIKLKMRNVKDIGR